MPILTPDEHPVPPTDCNSAPPEDIAVSQTPARRTDHRHSDLNCTKGKCGQIGQIEFNWLQRVVHFEPLRDKISLTGCKKFNLNASEPKQYIVKRQPARGGAIIGYFVQFGAAVGAFLVGDWVRALSPGVAPAASDV